MLEFTLASIIIIAAIIYFVPMGINENSNKPIERRSPEQQDVIKSLLAKNFNKENIKEYLESEEVTNKINHEEVAEITRFFVRKKYNDMISDNLFSGDELVLIKKIITDLDGVISLDKYGINSKEFSDLALLGLISEGRLPVMGNSSQIGVIFKDNEKVHYATDSALLKIKSVTVGYNYSGFQQRIRIAKGLTYRIGNIRGMPIKETIEHREDSGVFWISNTRIGFKGDKKNFSIPLGKIASIEIEDGIMKLFKDGKESPYLLSMDRYSAPMAVINFLLNYDELDLVKIS